MSEEIVKAAAASIAAEPIETVDEERQVVYTLPTYDDIDDSKAVENAKSVFKKFEYIDGNAARSIDSVDALVAYYDSAVKDINAVHQRNIVDGIKTRAASLVRMYSLCRAIQAARHPDGKERKAWGTNANKEILDKLADLGYVNKQGKPYNESYLYQLEAIAKNLTVSDCYLLGARGCTITNMKQLALVKDDEQRKSIVRTFVEQFSTTDKLLSASKALQASITMTKEASDPAVDVEASNPVTEGDFEAVSEAYAKAMESVRDLERMTKKLSDELAMADLLDPLVKFKAPRDYNGDEDARDKLLGIVGTVKDDNVQLAIRYLEDSMRALETLQMNIREAK